MRHHFGELRTALADGWEIVQPIFARPLWSVLDDSTTAFNFVLAPRRPIRGWSPCPRGAPSSASSATASSPWIIGGRCGVLESGQRDPWRSE